MRSLTTLATLATLAALGGCYRPSIANCQYACDNNACPSGLTCSAGFCVANVGDSCAPGLDASGLDAAAPVDSLGPPGCAWGYAASNIDPCQFTGPVGDWIVTTGATFDTDSPGASGDYPPAQAIHVVLEGGDQSVVVVFVHQLQVQAPAMITVTGSRPLLIYADDAASIAGAIDFSAASSTCPGAARSAKPGAPGTGDGGGGGGAGGSFGLISLFATVAGARGGDGGDVGSDLGGKGGSAGNPEIDTALVPILPGCPGAAGGIGQGGVGGGGGLGGGALQISTRGALMVSGQIRASGAGGVGGIATSAGAGGGGSGGAILLEGMTVTLASGAFLCANGGGGGSSGAAARGELGRCAGTTAKGAMSSGGPGGDGEATAFSAVVGGAGAADGGGGGGGGGGVGVIHVNGAATLDGGSSPRP